MIVGEAEKTMMGMREYELVEHSRSSSPAIPPDRAKHGCEFCHAARGELTNTKGQVSLSQDIRCTTTVQFDRRYRRYICGFVDLLDRDGGLPSRESRSVGADPVTNIEVEANQFVNVLSEI